MAQNVVNGTVEPGFQPVRRLFGQLFRSPGRGGGSLVVRQGDRVLIDIWAGVADPVEAMGCAVANAMAPGQGRFDRAMADQFAAEMIIEAPA